MLASSEKKMILNKNMKVAMKYLFARQIELLQVHGSDELIYLARFWVSTILLYFEQVEDIFQSLQVILSLLEIFRVFHILHDVALQEPIA